MNKTSLSCKHKCTNTARVSHLLRAELSRRCMSILFIGELLYLAAHNLLQIIGSSYGFDMSVSYFLYDNTPTLCIFVSAISSVQISQELDGRTIDNKLLAGFDKRTFFKAEVICSVIQGILLLLTDTIFVILLSTVSGYPVDISLHTFCANLLVTLTAVSTVAVISAVFSCMLSHRLISICIVVGVALLLLYCGQNTVQALEQPSQTDIYNTEHIMQTNPLYISGDRRAAYKFHLAASPYAQAVYANSMQNETTADQISNSLFLREMPFHLDFIIVDLGEGLLLCMAGVRLFERKDLR